MNIIRHYIDNDGRNHFAEWWLALRDKQAKMAVDRRIKRMEAGNFGDCKPLRDGVWELRIDVGPGYRVYYAKTALTIILLLCGGDKRKQDADIVRACENWRDWQGRKDKP
jgi:putative addiction module killer protein